MTEEIAFITKHKKKGALLDANILLVYLIGSYDMGLLKSYHHTQQFFEGFPLIHRIVQTFSVIYTTPNILTEVNSLGKKLGETFYDALQKTIPLLEELVCISKEAALNPHFNRIGLTDSALASLAQNGILVISADYKLCLILRHKNLDAVNFNFLLKARWDGLI
jgi:hypothetical protein